MSDPVLMLITSARKGTLDTVTGRPHTTHDDWPGVAAAWGGRRTADGRHCGRRTEWHVSVPFSQYVARLPPRRCEVSRRKIVLWHSWRSVDID